MTTQPHPHQDLLDAVPGHPALEDCPISECMVCSCRDCPWQEPLHHHHDGCPACASVTRCNGCGNVGHGYYDPNPHNLPATQPEFLGLAGGRSIASLFGCARTGENGAERCRKCHSLDVSPLPDAEVARIVMRHQLGRCWGEAAQAFLAETFRVDGLTPPPEKLAAGMAGLADDMRKAAAMVSDQALDAMVARNGTDAEIRADWERSMGPDLLRAFAPTRPS